MLRTSTEELADTSRRLANLMRERISRLAEQRRWSELDRQRFAQKIAQDPAVALYQRDMVAHARELANATVEVREAVTGSPIHRCRATIRMASAFERAVEIGQAGWLAIEAVLREEEAQPPTPALH